MFKPLSESETEMDCGFICLTDEYLIQSEFWKMNKLKVDIKPLFQKKEDI